MSETETMLGVPTLADDPLLAGGLLGVAPGVVERFLVHFELATLVVGFVVVGASLAGIGSRTVDGSASSRLPLTTHLVGRPPRPVAR